MKYIIAGGRDFNNYSVFREIVSKFLKPTEDMIVSGAARGADTLAIMYANQYGITLQKFPAQWDLYGKSAGFIRNAEMANYGDALIAFWDGKSKGTAHMIQSMSRLDKPVYVFNYKGEPLNV